MSVKQLKQKRDESLEDFGRRKVAKQLDIDREEEQRLLEWRADEQAWKTAAKILVLVHSVNTQDLGRPIFRFKALVSPHVGEEIRFDRHFYLVKRIMYDLFMDGSDCKFVHAFVLPRT